MDMQARNDIEQGRTALGIELGSTRIKAVLIGADHGPIASGDSEWENRLENGIWTYHLDDVWSGIQAAYAALKAQVRERYAVSLTRPGAIGISAMMHGYLPFDREGRQLAEFRTWRNTVTETEAAELTELFGFNIPQRWSIAHLWRAVRNGEPHVPQIAFLTTLEGYVHWQLTGEKVLGVGEAAGMFPLENDTLTYDPTMVEQFEALKAPYGLPWKLRDILPKILLAGDPAGVLTETGARLLDPSGELEPGVPFCPPEGDAGTGMTATQSISPRTGNVSAGTSIFSMVVLEHGLSRVYPEIDLVATPTGRPVAMVHCNTCTSDLDAWVRVFGQALSAAGVQMEKGELYQLLYRQALQADPDCGGLVSYNYYAGEPVLGLEDGRPLLTRAPEAKLTLPNLMRAQLFAAMATLQIGMELLKNEHVALDKLYGHGGLFKTKGVGQRLMAGALNVPVAVMETAGEGGPWGMALLAAYAVWKAPGESLEDYLAQRVFAGVQEELVCPDPQDAAGYRVFAQRYRAGLALQKAAVQAFREA